MASISRVDQAILLLRDRLNRLQQRSAGATGGAGAAGPAAGSDPMVPLRQLVGRGRIEEGELRRALVRTLLADALGDQLVGSLEFQSVADQVFRILDESDAGRNLLARALGELG